MWRRNRWIFVGGAVAFVVLYLILRMAPRAPDDPPPTSKPTETTATSASSPPRSFSAPAPTPTASPRRAPSDDPLVWRTKEGFVGATSRAKLDQAMALVASGDRQAFEQLLASEPANVFLLAPGTEVYVSDLDGIVGGIVKIRKKGTTAEIWTLRAAIEQ